HEFVRIQGHDPTLQSTALFQIDCIGMGDCACSQQQQAQSNGESKTGHAHATSSSVVGIRPHICAKTSDTTGTHRLATAMASWTFCPAWKLRSMLSFRLWSDAHVTCRMSRAG